MKTELIDKLTYKSPERVLPLCGAGEVFDLLLFANF